MRVAVINLIFPFHFVTFGCDFSEGCATQYDIYIHIYECKYQIRRHPKKLFCLLCCLSSSPPSNLCMCDVCALGLLIKCYGVHNLSTKIIKRKTQFIAHTRTYARTHLPRSKRYNKLIYRLHALTIWVFELRDKSCSNTNTHTLTLSLLRKIHLHVSRHFH